MLIHWTKKIIVEEGHAGSQLIHILNLIVRHNKVYYPVRHQLVQHMVTAMQRLAFTGAVCINCDCTLSLTYCEAVSNTRYDKLTCCISTGFY